MKKLAIILILFFAIAINANSQWQQLTGFPSTGNNVKCMVSCGTELFAGIQGSGVYKSSDDGATWDAVNNGLTSLDVRAMASDGTNIFAGTSGGGVFLSTDNGASWTLVNAGLPTADVNAIVISGSNIFVGFSGSGVYLSANNGTSWTAKNTSLTNLDVKAIVAMSPYVTIGTVGGGVFISFNNGDSWSEFNDGLTDMYVKCFGMADTHLFTGTSSGVFETTGGADPWGLASPDNTGYNAIVNSGSSAFAGSSTSGVFSSVNYGLNWSAQNTGLADLAIASLFVNGPYIFAGTENSTVYRRFASEMTGINMSEINSEISVYPNPASYFILIDDQGNYDGNVMVIISDMHGSVLKTVFVKDNQTEINISDLCDGLYLIELRNESHSSKRKLVIRH